MDSADPRCSQASSPRVLVTGGSRGIGREIVETLLTRGHDVVWTYRQDPGAAGAQNDAWSDRFVDRRCEALRVDLQQPASVQGLLEALELEDKGLDAVVNNAGMTRDGLVATMEDEEWEQVLRVNLTAPFWLARGVLSHFLGQRRGAFVHVSSIVARGAPGQANYAASKAGLEAFSTSLAREYGRKGIRSNVVAPGMIDTDMTRDEALEPVRKLWAARCPSPRGRMGRVREVANAVCFLLSPDAAFINGQVLGVDGGLSHRP